MKPITSLFDLFNKAKTDKRYKDLLKLAYQEFTGAECDNYGLAKAWVNGWVKRRVGPDRANQTCEKMVYYINDLIPRIEPIEAQPETPPIANV